MKKYVSVDDIFDVLYPVDPECDGSDGCTVVLQNLTYSSTDIEGMIDQIPAADVAHVVHGKWERISEDKYRCSNCGRITRVDECMGKPMYIGCPYCMAKMDVKE